MDLKDFIKETIGGIIEAASELQDEYDAVGVIINPPASAYNSEQSLYEENGTGHTFRRVETIEFDVAVSASEQSGSGGKAGLKILSVEAGLDGKISQKSEQASRVRFSIPITLPPSKAEESNRAERDKEQTRTSDAMRGRSVY